ncbi:SidA/IucD/PvdA family monooxygenase [Streptomyces broussonetiae]|uniref:L-lysine N6-monooxygenase MbtG n=2 Tax=Streptomyces broussonetiae TaxID=2686304 RepID=A0A6I6NCF6_9ACTN|nr:lysine N(6)-hydroxylase/L-ornithine N(5)-oxygenase family protein [Streptomyces broussonetiae]QHA08071.1 SidA/IucD/PvdA family monooxygenase [Streptomyces broussonetiae]
MTFLPSAHELDQPDSVYDIVGVGFGPANLALAIAIEEHNETVAPDQRLTAAFLEKQPSFGWHRGMLIEGATMQVSFLKDLATMRNPNSRFSFVSYLHDKGRLVDFINHKVLYPTREEFHDYLRWCADGVDHMVRYGLEVTAVEPVAGSAAPGPVREVEVSALDVDGAERATYRARNLALGTGLVPRMPDGVVRSARVWHSSEFLHRLADFPVAAPRRFVVVGAGQSAAEVADHLHRTYDGAEVCSVLSRYGYSPADDSPYANRIFDPEAVDLYHGADASVRNRLMEYHRNTNYGVVDIDLIDELYRRSYQEKVRGENRLRIMGAAQVTHVEDEADGVAVQVRNLADGSEERMTADVIVYATGYTEPDHAVLLGSLTGACRRDDSGRLLVHRDYRLHTDETVETGFYLQGGTEHTHGITGNLLSMVAVRAGEIRASLVARRHAPVTVPV